MGSGRKGLGAEPWQGAGGHGRNPGQLRACTPEENEWGSSQVGVWGGGRRHWKKALSGVRSESGSCVGQGFGLEGAGRGRPRSGGFLFSFSGGGAGEQGCFLSVGWFVFVL